MVIVFTGDGKGKTSAALGTALRAYGHNLSVSLIQFIKGSGATGESLAAERLGPRFEFLSLGNGFVNGTDDARTREAHVRAAEEAFAVARQRVVSDSWDIVILDEINNAVALGLLDVDRVLTLVRERPPHLHLILTGRNAHPAVIAAADLVTEMRAIKHPYDEGRPAVRGIDF